VSFADFETRFPVGSPAKQLAQDEPRAAVGAVPKMPGGHASSGTPRIAPLVTPRGQASPRKQMYRRFNTEATAGSTLLQNGNKNLDYIGRSKIVCLESEPMLTLPKKDMPKLGRMKKTTLQNLKMAEAKFNAGAIMSSLDPDAKPRYAKTEHYKTQSGRRGVMPHIEVLEVEGTTLLGIPGTSNVQQYGSYVQGMHKKQIVIAVHEHKPVRRQGAGGSTESDAAIMRSGVANLSKQLSTLRDSLAQSRSVHNTFANEAQKFFAGPKY